MVVSILLAAVVIAAFALIIFGPSEINDETYRKKK